MGMGLRTHARPSWEGRVDGGVEGEPREDLQYAHDLGLGLKLIGTAERVGEGIAVHVHPAFLYAGHPLASVSGPRESYCTACWTGDYRVPLSPRNGRQAELFPIRVEGE